ncbi:MAG: carboxymuconolactone decarboxylase family protein [Candidatus Pacebacteria bacterium]|nr:carboxymuconolactone decarboxylase family protein [Candidatus Paceibacterota bacterium]
MADSKPIVHLVTAEEVKDETREFYEQFTSAGKKVPKWMKVMANCEDILVGFFTLFKATMDDAPLPAILKWKVADEVSRLNKCEFCLDVTHIQLRQFGLTDEDVSKIVEKADEREHAALEFARAVTKKAYEIDPKVIENVKKYFNDEELVELTAVIGLFNYINRFNDALGVFPE